jgi:hypothetical protein
MIALEISLRTMLAIVFGSAAVAKLSSRRAFTEFARSLDDITWLRGRAKGAAAVAVPVTELATLALVVWPVTVMWGFAAAAIVLGAFTMVAVMAVRHGSGLRCKCFGAAGGQIGPAQIVRNVALIGVSVTGLCIAPVSHGGISAAGVVLACGLALMAAAAVVRWDDLASLVRTP